MSAPAETPAGTSVPADITEYQKFVSDGGLKPASDAKRKTTPEAASDEDDDETAPAPEPGKETTEPRKKQSGFQRRVTRLNREIGARDAEIADLKRKLEAPDATKPAAAAKPEDVKKRPVSENFASYDDYIEALTDWKTEQKLQASEEAKATRQQQQADQAKGSAVMDAHNARVDEAKTRYPDWQKAFKGLDDNSFTDAMMAGIFESEVGPDITYHLATNRDELKRIAALTPVRQAAEIGKLELKFSKERADDADDEPEVKPKPRVTQAPAPAKPLKGKSEASDPMPDPSDFTKYEAWAKRKAAKALNN